jgi:hypothetical protein
MAEMMLRNGEFQKLQGARALKVHQLCLRLVPLNKVEAVQKARFSNLWLSATADQFTSTAEKGVG